MMASIEDQSFPGKRRSRFVGCGIAFAIVAILAAILAAVITLNNRPISVLIPTHTVPKDNGLDYFVRAGDMIAKAGHFGPLSDPKGPGHWTMPDYEAFVKANTPALAVFRQGLSKPCVCPPARGIMGAQQFSGLAEMRELARTIRSEAMYYEKKGEYGHAVESQLDCMEMGAIMPRGGGLIHGLVGIAIQAIGCHGIGDNLARLSPSELACAAAHAERIRNKMVPYGDIIIEDSYLSASEYSEILTQPSMSSPLVWPSITSVFGPRSSAPSINDFLKGGKLALCNKSALVRQNLDYAKALAAETQKPYTGNWSTPAPNNIIAQQFGDIMMRGRQSYMKSETKLALIEAEIALRRFNADNGQYPANLQQLVPKYVKSLPTDPCGTGNQLRYRQVNGGKNFLLYSLGFDLKDDGGKPGTVPSDWYTGDVSLAHP